MSTVHPLRPVTRDETFRPFGAGIHVATGSTRFMGITLANTTALIEHGANELLVWNASALTSTLLASLRDVERKSERRVTILLAPMDYHHAYIRDWQGTFPDAKTYLVSERIRDHQPNARGKVLAGDRPVIPGCEYEIALLSVRGCLPPKLERSPKWKDQPRREWFVFHRASRTLLIGDMFIATADPSWLQRKLLRFRDGLTYNGGGFRTGDRNERSAFLREALSWDIGQALTVHGTATAHDPELIRRDLSALIRS